VRISELWRYPVKSMAGERLHHAMLNLDGIPGDRALYVVDGRGQILSARTKPKLLLHQATISRAGEVLVDGLAWDSSEVAAKVRDAAGRDARLVPAEGPERFDILPLLVASDGAITALGHDGRRLRPNIVIGDVEGLEERRWEGRLLTAGTAVIALAELRRRCIMTTWDPDTIAQDVGVLLKIRRDYDSTFALNAWAGRPGKVALDDAVELLEQPIAVAKPAVGRYG
jgi:MOSC domain-containing protein